MYSGHGLNWRVPALPRTLMWISVLLFGFAFASPARCAPLDAPAGPAPPRRNSSLDASLTLSTTSAAPSASATRVGFSLSLPPSATTASLVSALPVGPPRAADADDDVLDCACGCGVFDVGNIYGMVPAKPTGGMVWLRYNYMDQDVNWEGSSRAPSADNQDKRIQTSFFTFGGQYTLDRNWTIMAEAPFYDRSFTTTDNGTVFGANGSVYTAHLFAIGDLRVMGDYTGLSPDMSTGFIFGLKLPTGLAASPNGPLGGAEFDSDSLPGTGSTDLLLGAYHLGSFTPDNRIPWWIQANFSMAFITRNDYRPGNELDTAAGVGYNLGPVIGTATTPTLQLLGSFRDHDSGFNADPLNSGYSRILLAPGVEFKFDRFIVYTDVEWPIFQRTNAASNVNIEGTSGQLVAPVLYKVQVGYQF